MDSMIRGRVLNDIGFPLEDVTVRLFGDAATLGGDPHATTANQAAISWTRAERGLTGTVRGVWLKLIADTTAGITWEEFRTQVMQVNPALNASDGRFQPDQLYLLPENRRPDDQKIAWNRPLTGFAGNRWACWRQNVQGKVVGVSWRRFRKEVLQRNPRLVADGGQFRAANDYLLPANIGLGEYVRVACTRTSGGFTFAGLPAGTYRLEVHVEGYEPWTQTIGPGSELPLRILLRRLTVALAKGLQKSPQGISFVQVRGNEFVLENRSFRFIGVNLRGLVHYGSDKFQAASANQAQQLRAASDMGVRVVRVFLPVDNVNWRTEDKTEARLDALLHLMETDFRHMYLIVCLTNLYQDTAFKVFGDDEGDEKSCYNVPWNNTKLLGRDWFLKGYQDNYLKFVQKIVPKYKERASIMAWEPGNELKLDREPKVFVDFMLAVAKELQALAPDQLVTTGMISTQHADMDPDDANRRAERLRLLSSPLIDFITVHSYNGVNEHKEESDAALAQSLPKPVVVEEAGFVAGRQAEEEAAHNPDFHIPGCVSGGRRRDCVRADMDKWFNEKKARGYMQWGFMAGDDNGDGDGRSGMDHAIHSREDWDELFSEYQGRAATLAAQAGPVAGPAVPGPVAPAKPPVSVPAMQLQVGQQIRVRAAKGLNVRREPGHINKLAGDVMATLPAGTRLAILDGPKPQDKLIWWAVSFVLAGQTVRGWVAQADGAGTQLIAA